jgi:hypothetical protein
MIKAKLLILFILFFASFADANDWRDIQWKSGQVLGISSRSGLTPLIVQIGTLSQVDHLGIVSVENGVPWLYEYVKANGVQKVPLSEVWMRSTDRNGNVQFVLGELAQPLSSLEWKYLTSKFDVWISKVIPNPPVGCIDAVIEAFVGIREFGVDHIPFNEFTKNAIDGKLLSLVKKAYPGQVDFPMLSSIFKSLRRVNGNLPMNLVWDSRSLFLSEWLENGDLSKFVRLMIPKSNRLNPEEIDHEIQDIAKRLESDAQQFGRDRCEDLFH